MAKLKVPSIQHLARNWKSDSGMISRDLVRLVKNPPMFNYRPVFSATVDMLQFQQPIDEILEGIRRSEKRESIRNNYLELLPIINDHFQNVRPDFVNPVSTRIYPIGAGLDVPFTPPLIYGVGGQLKFPWFSFWKSNPLKDKNLRLFVTVVDEILRDDPDLEDCVFEILDFSAPKSGEPRSLSIINADDVEPLSAKEKAEMLEIFVDGYLQAQSSLKNDTGKSEKADKRTEDYDPFEGQLDLWDH